jgi:hypothetical protein
VSSATRVPSSLNVCAHRSAPQVLQCVVWYICLLVADLTVPGTTCRHHKAVILLLPLATLLRGAGAVAGQRRAVASAGRHTCGGGQQPVPHAPQVRDRRWQAACQRQPELDGTGVLWLPLQSWSRLGKPLLRQQFHMGSSAGVAKLRVLKSSRAARQPGNSRVRRPVCTPSSCRLPVRCLPIARVVVCHRLEAFQSTLLCCLLTSLVCVGSAKQPRERSGDRRPSADQGVPGVLRPAVEAVQRQPCAMTGTNNCKNEREKGVSGPL